MPAPAAVGQHPIFRHFCFQFPTTDIAITIATPFLRGRGTFLHENDPPCMTPTSRCIGLALAHLHYTAGMLCELPPKDAVLFVSVD
jgi:hypothetical protein